MPLDPSRRAQLNFAKLKVLAASAGADGLTPLGFPGGAAASAHETLWVLGNGLGAGLLGPAMAVALKADGVRRLVVITDEAVDAGVLARRATYFAQPPLIEAASVDGTALAFSGPKMLPDRVLGPENGLAAAIEAAGADAVWEHGVLRAEVRGLEVARVEDDELVVGVGKHDREGHRMANPHQDPIKALGALVERVRAERRAGAPGGLMTSLSRDRWLRSILLRRPDLVGTATLAPVAAPLRRDDLRAVSIAPAVGVTTDGASVIVACSVGVDLDLVPSAADTRAQFSPDAELVLVVPGADALPSTYRVAAALHRPARVVTVPDDWPALGD